jgi:hypothetical protein
MSVVSSWASKLTLTLWSLVNEAPLLSTTVPNGGTVSTIKLPACLIFIPVTITEAIISLIQLTIFFTFKAKHLLGSFGS